MYQINKISPGDSMGSQFFKGLLIKLENNWPFVKKKAILGRVQAKKFYFIQTPYIQIEVRRIKISN